MLIPMPQSRRISNVAIFYDYGAQPDSATVLAHAFGEISGALLDFKAEILRTRQASHANDIANLLRELMIKTIEMEDLALRTADDLNRGSAA